MTPSHLLTTTANRSYFGEFTAAPLISWLNSPRRPQGDAIETILNLNAGLHVQSTRHGIEEYVARLVSKSRFAVAPTIESVSPDRWAVKWDPVGKLDFDQALALVKLMELGQAGLLDRVRKCPRCRQFFYAKFHHQRFDKLECQQLTFREDPDYKRRRADAQKRARHEAQLRQRKALELKKGKKS